MSYYSKDKHILKSISNAVEDFKDYKKKIDDGEITMLKTCYQTINNMTHDGFHPGTINCIAGHSGTGKTTLLNNIVTTIPHYNKNTRVLMLTLEMPSRALIARNISRFQKISVKDIAINKKLEDISEEILEKLSKLPIDYIEITGTPIETATTIASYLEAYKESSVLVALDHTLLVDGNDDASKISELVQQFNILRKMYPNSTYLVLSQLNDAMQDKDRVYQKFKMYPSYTDLYQGRKLYHICDTVIVLNNPSTYLTQEYGSLSLPLYTTYHNPYTHIDEERAIIYAHCIKGRDSGSQIGAFIDDLKYNELIELNIDLLIPDKPKYGFSDKTTKKTKDSNYLKK